MPDDSEKIKSLEKMQLAFEEEQKDLAEEQEHFKHEVHAYVEENRNDHETIRLHVSHVIGDVNEIKEIAKSNAKMIKEISKQQTETKLLIARFKGYFGALVFLFTSIGVAAKIGWEFFKSK